jgi:hypothetical protein
MGALFPVESTGVTSLFAPSIAGAFEVVNLVAVRAERYNDAGLIIISP